MSDSMPVQGEYHWHKHDADDEFFYVVEGRFWIDLEDRVIELGPGQGVVCPRACRTGPELPSGRWSSWSRRQESSLPGTSRRRSPARARFVILLGSYLACPPARRTRRELPTHQRTGELSEPVSAHPPRRGLRRLH